MNTLRFTGQILQRIQLPHAIVSWLILSTLHYWSLYHRTFGTLHNLLNVFEQSAVLGSVSLGHTLVILTGGIDLSIAGIIAGLGLKEENRKRDR